MRRALHVSDLLDDILPVDKPVRMESVEGYKNPLTLHVTPDVDVAVRQLAVLWKKNTFEEVFLELLRRAAPSPNGTAYEVACFGCGAKLTVKRRPIPGKHNWCENCKAAGEPAAQRAREYRQRKAGGDQ